MKLIVKLSLIYFILSCSSVYAAVVHHVDCDAGQSLANAIFNASSGDTVLVEGSCRESVVIKVDDLTLDGQGVTIIDAANVFPPGPVVAVEGGRGVVIKNVDVQNGIMGVALKKGAHVSLSAVTLRDQSVMGLNVIEKSLVSLNGVSVIDAGVHGMNIAEASNAKVSGQVSVSGSGVFSMNLQDGSVMTADNASIELNNNTFGFHLSVGSTAFVNDSTMKTNNNALIGVAVDNGSKMFMFSSTLEANNNGLDGIDCNINSNIDFDAASTVTANNNGRNGISLEDTTFNTFSFFVVPGPKVEASHNAQNGVILTLGSKFDVGINSEFVAFGNGSNGLLADDGSTAILTNTTITGHGVKSDHKFDREIADLRVTFGSRVTAVGDTLVGRTICDKSGLFRGGIKCKKPFIKP